MSNDDETVERIARLIYDADALRPRLTWERLTPLTQGEYRKEARAALSALPPRDELLREALSSLDALIEAHPNTFQNLRHGIGTKTPEGMMWLNARAAADKIRAALTQEKQT